MTDGVSNNARQKRTEQEREREGKRERESKRRRGSKDRCIGNWPGNCSHLHIENLDKLSVPRSADFFWATGKTMMRL